MIPSRVSLKNFLTFAADTDGGPIVLDFDGAALWSIAGINGAGKSAIFDAITYALFGEHRGGRQQDNRLIRKGATTAEVAFEFLHGDERYRVERSVTRKLGRQGQPRSDAKHVQAAVWADSDQAWLAIPDTDKPTELERWIRSLIGMGPETFRSSVLLRQGEADKLFNARASQRFQILAGLIDLRAYQRLEQLAVERRKAADTNVAALDQQLAEIDDVTDEQLAHAATELEAAEQAVEIADRQRMEADRRWLGAQRHADLQTRRSQLTARKGELDVIISSAETIRARAAERHQLEHMINPVTAALTDLANAAVAGERAADAHQRLEGIDLPALESDVTETAAAVSELDDALERLVDHGNQLAVVLMKAKEVGRCRAEQDSRTRHLTEIGEPLQLRGQAAEVQDELEATRAAVFELEVKRSEAIDRRGDAHGRLQHAQERLTTLEQLADEPTCSRCGQPVAPEHLHRERTEAEAELNDATAKVAREQAALAEIEDLLTKTKADAGDLDRRHREATKAVDRADAAQHELDRVTAQVGAAVADAEAVRRDGPEAELLKTVIGDPLDEADRALQSLASLQEAAKAKTEQAKEARDQARKQAQAAQNTLETRRKEHSDLERVATVEGERARHLTEQAELRLDGVPPDVASAVRGRDEEILQQLQTRLRALGDAPEALEQLEAAEAELAGVAATLGGVDDDLATIPPEHQVPVTDAQESLQQADQDLKANQEHRDNTRDEHKRLTDARRSRRRLGQQLAAARRRSRLAKRLATLLGKAELQGRLLTDATDGVEAYANDTLARISAGTLEIALRRDETGDGSSLDILVADRSSADEPLEVAFISGSQKFRVAVALAAGLGQYLGGNTAIRSLIIDEGFGSLDADGRQRMIEELRGLAEHLDRIIVVSHQDDFMDRTLFPTGFVLRKDGTRTTVERVG